MATVRNVILSSGEIYHIYNRGVERRTIFTNKREYTRILALIDYYKHADLPLRFSRLMELPQEKRIEIVSKLKKDNHLEVNILAYCFMPNHFHFLLKQEHKNGISHFISNICNSYCKYFNTIHNRVGPLFQGPFKAVRVESDKQLFHLSRYIHLNPVGAFLVEEENLDTYPWSSLHEYLIDKKSSSIDARDILENFKNREAYRKFIHDQINYARELEVIKHLSLEE